MSKVIYRWDTKSALQAMLIGCAAGILSGVTLTMLLLANYPTSCYL